MRKSLLKLYVAKFDSGSPCNLQFNSTERLAMHINISQPPSDDVMQSVCHCITIMQVFLGIPFEGYSDNEIHLQPIHFYTIFTVRIKAGEV